jgi:hypothetical protein
LNGATALAFNGSSGDAEFSGLGIRMNDTKTLAFGNGKDQTLSYTDGTGVTWNDGTDDFLVIADDQTRSTTGVVRLAHGEEIGWRNSIDSADVTLGLNASNHLTTGAVFRSLRSLVESGGWFEHAGTGTRIYSPAAGQHKLSDNTGAGVVLDSNDAADTLTIKDDAGTGAGNLSVTGNLTVTGTQTYYGSMYIDSTQTVTISTAATPVQATTFTAGADLNGTSVASSELTITNAGTYMIAASVSSNKASGAVSRTTKGYIYLDDGTPAALTGCQYWRSLSATNDVGSATIACIATVAAGDKLELWVENTDGTEDIEVQAATITARKL